MAIVPVLIPSPFLGPAVWAPVASALRSDFGVTAAVPPPPDPAAPSPAAVLAAIEKGLPESDDLVLVPHSNAGLYVPALVTARPVRGAVFVDAVLPPARGVVPVAPAGLRDMLRDRVDPDGHLPPWTRWWPEESVAGLFPNAETRARVEAEQARLPFEYLTARVDLPDGWDAVSAGYLSFGDTYADEREDARARGWPVRTMLGGHLHMLRDPAGVAAEIMEIVTSF
ncbi:hypothetical protein GA0074695_2406 [Micromonospora viridifaciens]|uniref:Alpha/beta hydrolase family protein n=1 Tax=Micromonospora viridifaciens TaxID=1881 RepID=A0A1C4WG54_MICVI|nr:hypothetical protein [Micromonospora viridifaciens]SCE95173.1 hypothetical protein GA0074695_2406 [Micromonospora viridifaciens]